MKFKIGDHIVVFRNHYAKWDLEGMCGEVMAFYKDKVAVKVDGEYNGSSGKGYFYFAASQLKLDENSEKEYDMDGMKGVVTVQFLASCEEVRYAYYEDGIAEGDIVVCHTAKHGLGIAKVSEVHPGAHLNTAREIVCVVDMKAYEARVEQRKKRAELTRRMDERVKKLQNDMLYEMLAKEDNELKELLEEYKTL